MFSIFGITILSDRLLNALRMTSFQEGFEEGQNSRPFVQAYLHGDDKAIDTLKKLLNQHSIHLQVEDSSLEVTYMKVAPASTQDYSDINAQVQAILKL